MVEPGWDSGRYSILLLTRSQDDSILDPGSCLASKDLMRCVCVCVSGGGDGGEE
jgi:hypothetical protein